MSENTLDAFVSVSEFAEEKGMTPTHMHKIVSESDVNPVKVWGNTRIFARETLEALYAERSKVAKTIRSMGYVSPEVFKELEQRYFTSLAAAAEEKAALTEALAKVAVLETTANGDTVAEIANFMEQVSTLTAELAKANERLEEQAETITQQNAVIVRATVENNDFVKQNDELRQKSDALNTRLSKALKDLSGAQEKNDAHILESLSKDQRIETLKNDIAHLNSQTVVVDMGADEKLSDAYNEIQTLKETIAEIVSVQSAVPSV